MNQKYRLSLVQANDQVGNNIILPLAIGVLWASAQATDRWTLEHVVFRKDDLLKTAIDLSNSHIVAMSMYVWNSQYQFELAQQIKLLNPNCYIVIGGPDIHENSDVWNRHPGLFDLAIVGEGEYSFKELLKQWPTVDVESIPGAWTDCYFVSEAPRTSNLDQYPSPYLTGFYDNMIAVAVKEGKKIQAVIQTNRGCPYHCAFCEEGREYKNKLHFYDEERIRNEIEWCGRNQVEYLSIADDNWGISELDVELVKHICETKLKYGFPKIMDATYAKNAPDRLLKIAQLDSELGTGLIRGLTIAYQSTNPATLTAIKRFNLVDSKQVELVNGLKKLNIPTYVEMIWPLPKETLDSFKKGIDQVIDNGTATWLAVYPLNLLNSTDLYEQHKNDYTYPTATGQTVIDNFYPSDGTYPIASRWCDHDTVIEGHLLYGWTAILHYFGFAHPMLKWLKNNRRWSTTDSVLEFRKFLQSHSSVIADIDREYKKFWSDWLNRRSTNFSIFDDSRTDFWYPYTHLAARLQQQFDNFYTVIEQFLLYIGTDQAKEISLCCKKATVRYRDQFPSLLEFSEYYYWFNRKKGLSKLPVD